MTSKLQKVDRHIGCPAYPNCDESPLGCAVLQGKNVEWYGHRDKTENSIDMEKLYENKITKKIIKNKKKT